MKEEKERINFGSSPKSPRSMGPSMSSSPLLFPGSQAPSPGPGCHHCAGFVVDVVDGSGFAGLKVAGVVIQGAFASVQVVDGVTRGDSSLPGLPPP